MWWTPQTSLSVQQPRNFDGKKLESTAKDGFDPGNDDDEKNKIEELKAEFKPLTKLEARSSNMRRWRRLRRLRRLRRSEESQKGSEG